MGHEDGSSVQAEQCTLPFGGGKTIGDLLLLEAAESTGRWGSAGACGAAAGARLWQEEEGWGGSIWVLGLIG